MNGNTTTNPTFLWDMIGDVHVIVCGDRPLTDEEVEMYIAYTEKHIHRIRTCFCYSDKELPNPKQRARLDMMYTKHLKGKRRAQMAIVHPNDADIIFRGKCVALGFINPDSQGFSARKDQEAFKYLEIADPSLQNKIWDRVRELRFRLAGGLIPKPASEATTAKDHFDRANFAARALELSQERLSKIRANNAERDRREEARKARELASALKPGLAKTRPEPGALKKAGAE
jgi:hypothetical protein